MAVCHVETALDLFDPGRAGLQRWWYWLRVWNSEFLVKHAGFSSATKRDVAWCWRRMIFMRDHEKMSKPCATAVLVSTRWHGKKYGLPASLSVNESIFEWKMEELHSSFGNVWWLRPDFSAWMCLGFATKCQEYVQSYPKKLIASGKSSSKPNFLRVHLWSRQYSLEYFQSLAMENSKEGLAYLGDGDREGERERERWSLSYPIPCPHETW